MPHENTAQDQSDAIRQLKERLSGFETEEGRLRGLSYRPQSTNEIVISTTPKAGTTWMQQICHQLRSGGDMNFAEISEVVPWLELARDQGQDLTAPQYGHHQGLPRLFKTHAWEPHCPDFPKTIVVLRHPYDVVRSFYKFFEDWFFASGTLSLEAFARDFWLHRGVPSSRMENASYFVHLVSWWKRHDDPSVLIVFFEDLTADLRGQIGRVARFMSNAQHDFTKNIDLTVQRSTFEFMKAHEGYFDEKLSKLSRNEACGLPRDAGMHKSKLHTGRVGVSELSEELKSAVDANWAAVVESATGFASYDDLRASCSA